LRTATTPCGEPPLSLKIAYYLQNVQRQGCAPTNLREIITFPATGQTLRLAKMQWPEFFIHSLNVDAIFVKKAATLIYFAVK
jgi:hypothetical protein